MGGPGHGVRLPCYGRDLFERSQLAHASAPAIPRPPGRRWDPLRSPVVHESLLPGAERFRAPFGKSSPALATPAGRFRNSEDGAVIIRYANVDEHDSREAIRFADGVGSCSWGSFRFAPQRRARCLPVPGRESAYGGGSGQRTLATLTSGRGDGRRRPAPDRTRSSPGPSPRSVAPVRRPGPSPRASDPHDSQVTAGGETP